MGNPLGLGNLYWYNLFSWVPQIQDFGGSFSLPSVDGHGFLARQAANSSGYPEEQPQVPSHVGAHELRSWDARGREGLGWALSGWGHLWWPARKMMETGTRRPEELKRAEEKWSRERPSGRLSFFLFQALRCDFVLKWLEMAWNGEDSNQKRAELLVGDLLCSSYHWRKPQKTTKQAQTVQSTGIDQVCHKKGQNRRLAHRFPKKTSFRRLEHHDFW